MVVYYKDVTQKMNVYTTINFDNVDQISHKSIMYAGGM